MNICNLPIALLMNKTFMELFIAGRFIMWPILLLSFIGITVVIERILFIVRETANRDPETVEKMLEKVEAHDLDGAIEIGRNSKDYIVRILGYSLTNKEYSLHNAFVRASNQELSRFNQGMAILDTVITAAPLLGLLGTVTGMMGTFGSMGEGGDIAAKAGQITGGVAEALIATACGLAIAITGLLPFNYMNARIEEAKNEVADASSALEILLKKSEAHPFH
jgi:biopolymer transport protein ExbB